MSPTLVAVEDDFDLAAHEGWWRPHKDGTEAASSAKGQ
jgi:hypothetical protein